MITFSKNLINRFLGLFNYRISKISNSHELFKIHKYKDYEEYKKTQIFFNKKKETHVWSDEENLTKISEYINKTMGDKKINGICHGTRNGFEQKIFLKLIKNSKIIGTEISDTASKYENTVQHDFHNEKKEWISFFDFVYSNSLDQSYDPELAISRWLDQLKINGYLILEHSEQSGIAGSGKMDPFGVEANVFPYVLCDWFGHKISISILKSIKKNKSNSPIWIFFIKKITI